MKVVLKQNVEKLGFKGEIVKVSDGFARNNLFPRALAEEITEANAKFYENKKKVVEHRQEKIATQTSMLAESIKSLKLTLKRRLHDDGKLYAAVRPNEIVELLAQHGVSIKPDQVIFEKSIKAKGAYEVTIKLSSRLQPKVTLNVISE